MTAERKGRRGPGRPVGADAAQTRERIMRVGYEVTNERGYAATSLQEIAKRAGLSRPTVNYYFASRKDLYIALVEESHEVLAECIGLAQEQPTAPDQLRVYLEALLAVWQRDSAMMKFVVYARLEAERSPDLPDGTRAMVRQFLADVVSGATDRGELALYSEPEPLIDLLHAMLWGLGAYAVLSPRADNLHMVAKQFDCLLGGGLLTGVERAH